MILRNLEQSTVDIIAVESDRVFDTQFPKNGKPGPVTAADIDDRFGLNQVKNSRYNCMGGTSRSSSGSCQKTHLYTVSYSYHSIILRLFSRLLATAHIPGYCSPIIPFKSGGRCAF